MANVLITGGAGFIGSHTADALIEQGHRVRVLDRLDPQIHGQISSFPHYLHPAIECLRGDVRNTTDITVALEGIDVVYHFAALTGVGQSMYDIHSYVDTNCAGTACLLEAVVKREQKIKRLVLASSRAVYGEGTYACPIHGGVYPTPRQREDLERGNFEASCPECGSAVSSVPTREDRPLKPISVYAWTKQEQEGLCRYAARTFGLPVTILRYFNVYGSRQSLKNPYTGVVSIFFSRIMANQPIYLYEHGTPGRDFVHVSDVARANLRALEADVKPGTCINIGAGLETTIADVAGILGKSLGRLPQTQDCGEFRVGDIRSCYADLSRAREILGYAPRTAFEAGMREFVNWAEHQDSVDLYEKAVSALERHNLFGHASK